MAKPALDGNSESCLATALRVNTEGNYLTPQGFGQTSLSDDLASTPEPLHPPSTIMCLLPLLRAEALCTKVSTEQGGSGLRCVARENERSGLRAEANGNTTFWQLSP